MTLPAREPSDGVFPFGFPNGPRDWAWDGHGLPDQLVIGVYPSALHVRWRPPAFITPSGGARGVAGNLPIAPEPAVFWTGRDPDPDDAVDSWIREVGFRHGIDPGCHGSLGTATNGPSGARLDIDYFPGLPFPRERTAFLDVYPVYQVKCGSAKRRGQREAIEQEYNSCVDRLPPGRRGPLSASGLPVRLTTATLPALAAQRFGRWLVEALEDLAPAHVVTLGAEPWATLQLLPEVTLHAPAPDLVHTRDRYAEPGTLIVAGRSMQWTPLIHPGLLGVGSASSWWGIHREWLAHAQR